VTRALLETLAAAEPALVRVQTRAALATRDLDLLGGGGLRGRALLAVSVTTDNETARRRFEPRCAPIADRIAALAAARAAGVRTQACVARLLPGSDARRLADLLEPVADHVVLQGFQHGRGARTWDPGLALLAATGEDNWLDGGRPVQEAATALQARFGRRLRTGSD